MHNLILAGQAGTGKTFVLKEVARDLKFLEPSYVQQVLAVYGTLK